VTRETFHRGTPAPAPPDALEGRHRRRSDPDTLAAWAPGFASIEATSLSRR
jgi:hypothetical protein